MLHNHNSEENSCHLLMQASQKPWWTADRRTDNGKVTPICQPVHAGDMIKIIALDWLHCLLYQNIVNPRDTMVLVEYPATFLQEPVLGSGHIQHLPSRKTDSHTPQEHSSIKVGVEFQVLVQWA